jgi:hypothetical protein
MALDIRLNTELTVKVAMFKARVAIRTMVRRVEVEDLSRRERMADAGVIGAP